jgi:hypothetical protein
MTAHQGREGGLIAVSCKARQELSVCNRPFRARRERLAKLFEGFFQSAVEHVAFLFFLLGCGSFARRSFSGIIFVVAILSW